MSSLQENSPPPEQASYVLPTSFSQQRLWFLEQLVPDRTSYVVPGAWRLGGTIDVAAVTFAVNCIVSRHDTMRTTFVLENGEPVQLVHPYQPFEIPLEDLSHTPDPELAARESTLKEANRTFSLESGPIFRCKLLRLAPDIHILLFTTHHIVFDGWSKGVWLREFAVFYRDRRAVLPDLEIQYGDYAAWQREHLAGKLLHEHLSFWRTSLQGAPGLLELPTDRARPAIQSRLGATVPFSYDAQLKSGLHKIARDTNSTLFMVMLAAFQVLLSRYSGQNDLVIGTPIANRERLELEPLIGFFTNTLLMRGQINPQDSFLDVLAATRSFTLDAYAHQDMPFDKLVEHLQPERSPSYNPLFQVMFALHNPPREAPSLPGVTITPAGGGRLETKFDLYLSVVDHPEGFRGVIEYSTALFDASTIEQMLGNYRALLESIVAAPAASVSTANILTPEEKHQLLFGWNDTAVDFPVALLHQLFERQVDLNPEAPALHFGQQTRTYMEVERSANQFAHYLGSLGVGPGDLIGICMERSFEMVFALLGIFKAGAGYLALDPSYPIDRLAMMLEDGGGARVVAHQAALAKLPEGTETILFDAHDATWQQMSAARPSVDVSLNNLAYTIHTSGSTGRPKGAMVHHGGVANFVFSMQKICPLGAEDKFLIKTSLNFDASVWELFWPLSFGAQLVIAPPDQYTDLDRTIDLMSAHRVTYCFMVPSMLNAFLENPRSAALAGVLHCVLSGGEKLTLRTVASCQQQLPGTVLYQVYGPTETTITVAVWAGCLDYPYGNGAPLGPAFPNVQLYILDENMQPMPRGAAGELYIGGAQVGLGYLNRPDLTAERFLPNPFTGNGRMYKTGDRVRYLPDGYIEFIDRLDFQIKLRGLRIELGEIESALAHHPAIRISVVVARDDQAGDKRIVAYIVPNPGFAPEAPDLRRHLTATLPEYMVPAAFVTLDALPLSLNGKVDRRALPAPDYFAPVEARPPETETQQKIAAIWSEILKLDTIFLDQDFFHLGGHSLLATRVISRIREAFQIALPLRSIFEHPTLRALAEEVDAHATGAPEGFQLLPRPERIPLSFAQQRLWFLDQLEPNSSFYNVVLKWRLSGLLRVAALQFALDQIVSRHETLRTTFSMDAGEAVQIIAPPHPVSIAFTDLNEAPDREEQAAGLTEQESRRPFDLEQGPIFRAALLKLAEDDHVLILNTHHIATDGWSVGILRHELITLYEAALAGQTSPLAPLPLQYADYSVWQRNYLRGEALDSQLEYWRDHLRGAPPAIELPLDRPRPALQTYRGAKATISIPATLLTPLQSFSQTEGATLYMTLLAAFATLLSRYSGQEDIVIGSAIAGRTHATENLIGLFINTLALRVDLTGDPSFRELLQRVRSTTVEGYDHQDVPFERLVEELNPVRDSSRSPLFQVMLILQNTPHHKEQLPDVQMTAFGTASESSKMDLLMSITEQPSGLIASLTYNTDLFDPSTIDRMLASFVVELRSIVESPQLPALALPILTKAERERVLHTFNATQDEFRAIPLHQLVSEQAARTPHATAIVAGSEQITYAELDQRANRIAHELIARGAGADVLIGIYFERGMELLVAILAVLKSGSAYVPLDPNYPADRILQILEGANAKLILTTESLATHLPAATLWLPLTSAADHPTTPPEIQVAPHHLAYVLFTSGSTGKPKGVAIEHRSAATFIQWALTAFTPQQLSAVLFSTSVCFDLSIFEIFAPLASGGKILLAENALYLATLPARDEVTLINSVPSAVAELVRSESIPPSVRMINLAGEALSRDLVEEIYAYTSVEQVFNLYGPTEDTTYSTYTLVPRGAPVTIGRPLANTQALILSRNLQLQPTGVPGELYLAGAGLARGYLHRPDLTAERFVTNPFSPDPGARMYRTGDLCRWLADGTIEYFGRLDHQVKLRGFRIELGEIEHVLRQHAVVKDAVVIVREDTPGDKRLVAYLVLRSPVDTTTLRSHVKAHLPEYMVPAAVVLLDSLPLTPNGKIDRNSLPAPEAPTTSSEGRLPHTRMELLLADLWRDILQISTVHAEDDFFHLGGHSLKATRMVSRVRQLLSIELRLVEVFANPTLEAFAAAVERIAAIGDGGLLASLTPVERPAHIPQSYAQQRLWFLQKLQPESSFYNAPIEWRLRGTLNTSALERSINEIVARHEILRTTYSMHGDVPTQVVTPVPPTSLTVLDLTPDPTQTLALADSEAGRPFDLEHGPIFRATLLTLAEDDHVLILNTHHIATDGWSFGVLRRELAVLYEVFSKGLASPLAPLPLQYADYALWQRKHLQGKILDEQLAFWKNHLRDAPPSIELVTDRPRPALQTYRGARTVMAIPLTLLDSLKSLSQSEGATLYMTLLAAFSVLLSRYSSQQDIVIGSAIAGRTHADTENLIGLFVNSIAMRVNLAGDPTFRVLLHRVRETTVGAYTHQEVPFERLVEEINPVRDSSRSPLFQVMLNLQNQPTAGAPLPGLQMSPFGSASDSAKMDLVLTLTEQSDGLTASFTYSTALFDASTIEQMLGNYRALLESIVAVPDVSVSTANLLTSEERRQLLFGWNDTAVEFPVAPLHELFERQADLNPESHALHFGQHTRTYLEVERSANQFAHYLVSLGIGPGDLLGICMERSFEMVVALLGILKSGAGYLALDPSYPVDRLAMMLEDSCGARVVAHKATLARLPTDAETVLFDENEAAWRHLSAERPNIPVPLSSLAYVIHTSGSTGRPKGAMVHHGGIVNYVFSMQRVHPLETKDRFLVKTSLNFDAALLEIFWPLSFGAQIVIAPPDQHIDLDRTIDLISAHGVTVCFMVPSLLDAFLDTSKCRALSGVLRCVLSGGEKLTLRAIANCQKQLPGTKIYQVYGPAETAVGVTVWAGGLDYPYGHGAPLGPAFPNVQLYVLDDNMQPLPRGVSGELYIGGAQVGLGYLNRPDLTAERFLSNPFTGVGRIYKTGDRVRYLPDGYIEFIDRLDFQIKLRGLRIELGEIESALAQHPAVRTSVVVARDYHAGDKRIVAYLVLNSGFMLDSSDLRRYLALTLPEYMVPAAFVTLNVLPLSLNGKVDRKSLPKPDIQSGATMEGHAARTRMEFLLADIWKNILSVPAVHLEDDFFQLGGHSLMAAAMMSRLSEVLGYPVRLSALFEAPTLGALASLAEKEGSGTHQISTIVPIRKKGTRPAIFCVSRPNVNALGFLFLSRALSPEIPVYGLQSNMQNDGSLVPFTQQEYEEKATEYVSAMLGAQPQGPYFLTGYCEGAHIAFEMARLLESRGLEVGGLFILDVWPVENTISRPRFTIRNYGRVIKHFMRSSNQDRLGMLLRKLKHRAALTPKVIKLDNKSLGSADVDHEARKQLSNVAAARYWPGKHFSPTIYNGNIVVFRMFKQPFHRIKDQTLGWKSRVRGTVEVIRVPGIHAHILRSPGVNVVAEAMEAHIDQYMAHARNQPYPTTPE